MREFPQLVQLHRQYTDQVACLSVNVDFDGDPHAPPESLQGQVLALLAQREATFPNVICRDADEDLYRRLDLASIPAVLVYDRTGALRKRFDNDRDEYGAEGFTFPGHVVPLVEQLLGE